MADKTKQVKSEAFSDETMKKLLQAELHISFTYRVLTLLFWKCILIIKEWHWKWLTVVNI